MARSPLLWFGGKGKYATQIISKFPAHRKYVEPFGGGAHVIAQKPRIQHEVYNDIDGNVVNFLMMVRSDPEGMERACDSIPYSRQLFEGWKGESLPSDPKERAVRWFYMNRSAMNQSNAHEVTTSGWRNSHDSSVTAAQSYVSACRRFQPFADRMKGVIIEHLDFREIFEKYDGSDTLFYVDPPYVGREKQYAGGFTEKDHRDLADILHRIQGKAVLSYYSDPLVKELYSDWNKESFEAHKQVVGGGNNTVEELLMMNFDNGQMTLF